MQEHLIPKHSIFLFGLKHSGKSSQARMLSRHYSMPYCDLDDVILEMNPGYSGIRELYRKKGPVWFIEAEHRAYLHLSDESMVIATGGGSMENPSLLKDIKAREGISVFLDAPEEDLIERILSGGVPPFLEEGDPRENFHILYERRRPLGLESADLLIKTGGRGKDEVFHAIVRGIDGMAEERR